MLSLKKWNFNNYNKELAAELAEECNIDEFLAFDKIAAIGGSFFVKESLDKMEGNE